jgi:phosphoribosyl-AMP cyclohydrolase
VIIADRFPSVLKEKYDQKNIKQLDLEHLCRSARNFETKQEISEADKTAIRKRDLKTIEKYIRVQKMDQNAFEKTIEEIKYRYYEVSRRLLKFRGSNSHQYFKYQEFDIE